MEKSEKLTAYSEFTIKENFIDGVCVELEIKALSGMVLFSWKKKNKIKED